MKPAMNPMPGRITLFLFVGGVGQILDAHIHVGRKHAQRRKVQVTFHSDEK
jgi:hypothetical protein